MRFPDTANTEPSIPADIMQALVAPYSKGIQDMRELPLSAQMPPTPPRILRVFVAVGWIAIAAAGLAAYLLSVDLSKLVSSKNSLELQVKSFTKSITQQQENKRTADKADKFHTEVEGLLVTLPSSTKIVRAVIASIPEGFKVLALRVSQRSDTNEDLQPGDWAVSIDFFKDDTVKEKDGAPDFRALGEELKKRIEKAGLIVRNTPAVRNTDDERRVQCPLRINDPNAPQTLPAAPSIVSTIPSALPAANVTAPAKPGKSQPVAAPPRGKILEKKK